MKGEKSKKKTFLFEKRLGKIGENDIYEPLL